MFDFKLKQILVLLMSQFHLFDFKTKVFKIHPDQESQLTDIHGFHTSLTCMYPQNTLVRIVFRWVS